MAALSKVLELTKWERLSKQIRVQSMVSRRNCRSERCMFGLTGAAGRGAFLRQVKLVDQMNFKALFYQ